MRNLGILVTKSSLIRLLNPNSCVTEVRAQLSIRIITRDSTFSPPFIIWSSISAKLIF